MTSDYVWSKVFPSKSKLRDCVKFNQEIETSSYFKISLSVLQRSLMAKLRLCVLSIAIETGHKYRIPIKNRFCKLCQNEDVRPQLAIGNISRLSLHKLKILS